MTTRKLLATSLLAALSLLFFACEDSSTIDEIRNPQSKLRDARFSYRNIKNKLTELGVGGATAASFASQNAPSGRVSGGPMTARQQMANGRTETDVCFTETWTEYSDGSYEWSVEFLGGCNLEDEPMTGKIRGKGKYDENSFTETIFYENFGDSYFTLNGKEKSSGTWDYNDTTSEGEDWEDDDYWYDINSTFTFSSELEIVENYEGETFSYSVISNGEESYDAISHTVHKHYEKLESSDGEVYESEVTTALVVDYACDASWYWIPVSGVEESEWTNGNDSWSEVIDYGDGECDTMATITENGKTEEVDLADEWDWDDDCPECEDEEDGSTGG